MANSRPTAIGLLRLAACVLLGGCSSLVDSWSWPGKSERETTKTAGQLAAGPVQVKVDSFGKPLREGQESTISRADFLSRIDKLLVEQRLASARRWIERYPDVALELLRGTTSLEANSRAIQLVAETYDRQMGLAAADGWRAVLATRTGSPQTFLKYDTTRRLVLERIRVGQTREAAGTNLTSLAESAPGDMLDIDAWQLQAIALMLDDRSADAAHALRRALTFAGSRDAFQTAQILLLLSDVERRAGQIPQADQTWQQAVELVGRLIDAPTPIVDPTLWDRAAYLRPVTHDWPPAVAAALGRPDAAAQQPIMLVAANSPSTVGQMEVLVWNRVGRAHLDRDENQAALIALKRAETATTDDAVRNRLRLAQAQALSRMQQATAATAILVSLAAKPDEQVSRAALSTLGTQKLMAGDASAGHKLLNKALEKADGIDWPERGQAEADLGLACLICGDEINGLRWLHQAQNRFQATRDYESLAKSLWNEARYREHTGKKREAAELTQRLQSLERQGE